ncbi:MAG: hypothetical protein EA339_13730 [Rhodobacteraceae bacterium]|nr:MAG: hypothetical protein EA339_13730 [Paracoccaceae bacterium]
MAFALGACDSPSPWMASGTRHALTVQGVDFTVWQHGYRVEIIRHGFVRPQDQSRIRPLMQDAARQATGCDLRPGTVEGDTGVLRAQLDCRT